MKTRHGGAFLVVVAGLDSCGRSNDRAFGVENTYAPGSIPGVECRRQQRRWILIERPRLCHHRSTAPGRKCVPQDRAAHTEVRSSQSFANPYGANRRWLPPCARVLAYPRSKSYDDGNIVAPNGSNEAMRSCRI